MLNYNYNQEQEEYHFERIKHLTQTDNEYIIISGMISFLMKNQINISDIKNHILKDFLDNSKKYHIRKLLDAIISVTSYPLPHPFNAFGEELNVKATKKTYIIKDKSNGLYKIGRSINPIKREKTLQSEKPNLQLIKTWDADIEKTLHDKYRDFRVRGEWFKLSKVQIKYICCSL